MVNQVYSWKKIFASNLDSKYLETKDGNSTTEKLRMTAYDYVVNYYVNQYEIQNIFAGDMANYFKDGMSPLDG